MTNVSTDSSECGCCSLNFKCWDFFKVTRFNSVFEWLKFEAFISRVFLIRNKHFCFSFLFFEGKRRYNIKLWKTFTDCFNCLPVAAILDEKIFCCHGGRIFCRHLISLKVMSYKCVLAVCLKTTSNWVRVYRSENAISKLAVDLFPGLSPDLQSMEQIRRIMRPTDVPDQGKSKYKYQSPPFVA